ncbi:hypothetical protein K437DRAFT_255535 [Tilletiaria anomala UBC 951]|uniref:T6SS Phospholipase effector Tle1-like catalytic domain-containing protein n=1 Tax=Tilletiaria anomala (strain ATCC 24038 / CBS 436.72 / UBC 951) TaxID=1037660 RepID=A0A066WBH7_TILAU|nr:uncharacterized protein K437DRAFT_255535 [Tilletiaria anomala UBC 951]KDN48429.1 hypothetical protein K437DRAFT_255535 [Tilletiaria anomala UBC 951]
MSSSVAASAPAPAAFISLARRPPQNIVLLCDGTWQERRAVVADIVHGTLTSSAGNYLTNIALLAQAIAPTAEIPEEDGCYRRNVICYISGVGTTLDLFGNLVEGGTGAGLDVKVEFAYAFLCDNWQPGDGIFLFGFSRGAYTARCVGGLINWAGVLSKKEALHFSEVWQAYSKRDPSKPETDQVAADLFHERFGRWPNREASQVSSVKAEAGWAAMPKESAYANELLTDPTVQPPPIKVLGVWDTVGALGVPGNFANPVTITKWSFYDPGLGSNVEHAFHALALQEDRKDFLPTFWYQQADAPMEQVLKQVWFQGTHTDVGGGYGFHGLSDVTLAWMVAQMRDAPGGPLLNVDLDRLRELQDRRAAWAKQPAHRSRMAVEWQGTRKVGQHIYSPEQLSRVVWKNMVESGARNESIHHSVFVGGHYDPLKSEQFAELRRTPEGTAKLKAMWEQASDPESLLPTEKLLRWHEGEVFDADAAVLASQVGAETNGDAGKKPLGHARSPSTGTEQFFNALMNVATFPDKVVSSTINMRPTPSENLKPSLLGKGVETLRAIFYKNRSKDTIVQQVLDESS